MGSVYRPTFANSHGKRVQCKTYRISYIDENGDRKTEKGFRDRRSTEEKLRQLEDRVDQLRSGQLNAGAAAPWKESAEEYLMELRRLGRSVEYLKEIERALGAIFDERKWGCVGDVTANGLTAFLGALASAGRAPRTSNHYRDTLCSFLGFGVRQGWLLTNPVSVVPKASLGSPGDTSKRPRARRALTVDEFAALVTTAPPRRSALYQLAAFSGLRRRELWLLEKQDASFGASPTWHLRPEITKGKRLDVVRMTPDAIGLFRLLWEEAPEPTTRFFPQLIGGRTFAADLRRAGIANKDHRGRQADFHSLRYTFVVRMGLALPIQHVRVLARHRDIRTTLNIYMDLGIADVAEQMGELPRVMPVSASRSESPCEARSRISKSGSGDV